MARNTMLLDVVLMLVVYFKCHDALNLSENFQDLRIGQGEDCCEELRSENVQRKMEISQLTEQLQLEIDHRKQSEESLRNSLDQEIEERKNANDMIHQDILKAVPLGTILPWVNKPSIDSPHQEDLPKGFALCDGSVIEEGVWAGLNLPNLTDGRFLKGGHFDNILELEEDMVRDHTHDDPGHTHTDSGHTHTDGGHNHEYVDKYSYFRSDKDHGSEGEHYFDRYDTSDTTNCATGHSNIQQSSAAITISQSGIGGVEGENVGNEVRPKNMKSLFIMKIVA